MKFLKEYIATGNKTMKNTCCVAIPIHTLQMAKHQYASIVQTVKQLSRDFDIYIVHPQSLDIQQLKKLIPREIVFADENFKSWGSYNRMCMSTFFYNSFKQYDYMLIAQNDTWIFKNELQCWCDKGYDYIGAPLCHNCNNVKQCNYNEDPNDAIVGNGGLSLRRIEKFIQATKYIDEHGILDSYSVDDTPWEDLFLMRIKELGWNVPKCGEAVRFSIEGLALKHAMSGIMPFGYHNLFKIFPQAAFLLHFNNNIQENVNAFNELCNAKINN